MITTDFDKLSFHDATIEGITRGLRVISIEIEGAFMSKEHPKAEGIDWFIDKANLQLCNVTSEWLLFWHDDIEGKTHPQPELPLDEIMNLNFDGSTFEFGGMLKSIPWVQWTINATEFKLDIRTKHTGKS